MLASVMQMQLLPAVLALAAFLVAILLTLYIVRMLFGRRIRVSGGRNRPKRLDIVDAFDLDRERQLVIVRRDNVEHLLLIGGPTDVVIEPHIVRAAVAPREAARPLPTGEPLPRALPLGEGNTWPLQPEGGARAEPMLPRPEPAPPRSPLSSSPRTAADRPCSYRGRWPLP